MPTYEGGPFEGFRGNLGGLSFYKMRGHDKPIIRRSSGHTKQKIRTNPDLDIFKRNGYEFGGRTQMSKWLMRALIFQKPMADYNIAGPLTTLMKPIQKLDQETEFGQRSILLSQHKHFLKGFSLNKHHPFDTVITYPVTGIVDRENMLAQVSIPELIPGINFKPPVTHPYYGLRVSLAVVPDIVYNDWRYTAIHHDYHEVCACHIDSQWYAVQEGSPEQEMVIGTNIIPPDVHFTLVLAVGIRYGSLKGLDQIEQVKHAGAAKVLEVG